MTSKGKAILVLVIVIAGGLGGIYVYLNYTGGPTVPTTTPTTTTTTPTTTTTTPGPVVPVDTPSPFSGAAWISEVHMNSTLTVDDEYFELYIPESYSESSISGWIVTTFDEEGVLNLPTVSDVDAEDYVAVFSGSGTDDLNASDGTALIHLGLSSRILDPTGDEIGVFDSDGEVIDFMRYAGGNGDSLYDNWPSTDDGPSLPAGHNGSISLFGEDMGTSENWLTSETTPGAPNQHLFYTTGSVYPVSITSGVNKPYSFIGIDDTTPAGKNATINILPAPGVDNKTIQQVKEHINFSLNFYKEKGFDRGPATDSKGRINITISKGTTTETTGAANSAGTIKIKLGTVNSSIDLKYVCEHELMHLFQYNTEVVAGETVDHAPGGDKFFIEGEATYWGIESTKANYKLNDSQIQKEFERVGDHNWFDHYLDLNRTIFKGWGGKYDDYMGSYLFMKFIKEKYGEDKIKEAFDEAKDNFDNDSKDVGGREAFEKATGKSWADLLGEFHAWLATDAIKNNGMPPRNVHVTLTYNNNTVNDTVKVGPYGGVVERIKVNDTKPFTISFNPSGDSKWRITIIYVYEDGTRKQAFNTPFSILHSVPRWGVDPSNHQKKLVEVLVIKTNVQDTVATIGMTATPVNQSTKDDAEEMLCGTAYLWSLPYDTLISTDEWPWSKWWWFDYTQYITKYTLTLEFDHFEVDSFFDIYFELDGVLRYNLTNIPAQSETPVIIEWDPDMTWDLGTYYIYLVQSTWNSSANGTLTCTEETIPGSCFSCPYDLELYGWIDLNSTQYPWSHFYIHVSLDTLAAYIFDLWIEPQFQGTANWYMDLYNPSNPDTPILSSQSMYSLGQWPRRLVAPTPNHPLRVPGDEYICKVVYDGEANGSIILFDQPVPGTNVYECVPYSPGDDIEVVWYITNYWACFNISDFDGRYSYLWQLTSENWTMRLYDESLTLINDTSWHYPYTQSIKTLYMPTNSTPQIYYLEVIFNGTEILGDLECIQGPMIPGACTTCPLWHTVDTTQYLGCTLPYTHYGVGEVFINCSVPVAIWINIFVNVSGPVEVWVFNGTHWVNSTYQEFDDHYYYGFEPSVGAMISIAIVPKTPEGAFVHYLWTQLFIE